MSTTDTREALAALQRLMPAIEKGIGGLVFTADKAGEIAADMNTLRAALATQPAQPSAQGEAVAHVWSPESHIDTMQDRVQTQKGPTRLAKSKRATKTTTLSRHGGPVAWGFRNTAITGRNRCMILREDVPANDQYDGAMWVPLYESAPAAPAQAVPLTDEHVNAVVRSVQPYLSTDCKAWRELTETCRYWLQAERGIAPKAAPLTDEQIHDCILKQWAHDYNQPLFKAAASFARAIERAHGIKAAP